MKHIKHRPAFIFGFPIKSNFYKIIFLQSVGHYCGQFSVSPCNQYMVTFFECFKWFFTTSVVIFALECLCKIIFHLIQKHFLFNVTVACTCSVTFSFIVCKWKTFCFWSRIFLVFSNNVFFGSVSPSLSSVCLSSLTMSFFWFSFTVFFFSLLIYFWVQFHRVCLQ